MLKGAMRLSEQVQAFLDLSLANLYMRKSKLSMWVELFILPRWTQMIGGHLLVSLRLTLIVKIFIWSSIVMTISTNLTPRQIPRQRLHQYQNHRHFH